MNQREKVKRMLEQAGGDGVTTGDFLSAYLPRFSARIKELRDEGLSIETTRLKGSSSRYTLQPVTKTWPVEGTRGESVGLGASEREPRVSSSTSYSTSQRRIAAANSGKGCGVPGGGSSRAVTATPTLFELDADRPSNYYEGEAA